MKMFSLIYKNIVIINKHKFCIKKQILFKKNCIRNVFCKIINLILIKDLKNKYL